MPHYTPYSTVEGDIWALGCILAEMIANVRPWRFASSEDRDYSDYLGDRTTLFEMFPISDAAYTPLTKISSTQLSQCPSLAAMREEVLVVDTFFVSGGEVARWGWKASVENELLREMGTMGRSSRSSGCSEETSSGTFYSGTSSSSASLYSCGSSSLLLSLCQSCRLPRRSICFVRSRRRPVAWNWAWELSWPRPFDFVDLVCVIYSDICMLDLHIYDTIRY